MPWTVEQVLSLAPDASAAAAGRSLAKAPLWQTLAQNPVSAWGEVKGSGSKPYQVVVDLSDGATKCSCPSRKFPCKHAIGLLLLVAQAQVAEGVTPVWAQDWLDKRGAKQTEKLDRAAPKPPSEKTRDKRWADVVQGLGECQGFLVDAIEVGLAKNNSVRSWDEMASRMVDAKAPGLELKLRRIGEIIGVGTDWASKTGADLGSIALLIEASQRIESLGELAHDVRASLGITIRQQELESESGIIDVWDVLGAASETVKRVTTSRTWIYGRGTKRWALHLSFSVGGSGAIRPAAGRSFASEAKYFPSAYPLRAIFGELPVVPFFPAAGATWFLALDAYASALAKNPWTEQFPVHLTDARLGQQDGTWRVIDSEGAAILLVLADEQIWEVLARTGNHPAEMFGEFDGRAFRLLTAWGAWGFVSL